ncbi:helix-turn-helix domain-containing protein [Streptomyces sp. SL13]|uniref:Helix-turn-helix domain-containing protein n=1 Tax=Streptantibioticus silvisoli TaxID=2705255 RepID=A0AA90H838_9ACTN|nr:helix-turn-helix domain-containing protein [Streptantibioticus silvisoli]MDI5967440.1 helix-turn-helix domain-containing protein [Streptantibioticus silvisoli]MDI5973641.1 helix-turn-helix domain-containing protein [Streptantibioticus silvisoli]
MIEANTPPLVGTIDIRALRLFLVGRRRACGWTQEELAERSGVSVRTIRNIETGSNINPRRASVELLLAAFGDPLPRPAGDDRGESRRPGAEMFMPRPREQGWFAEPTVNPARWRGARPVGEPMVGRREDLRHVLGVLQRSRLLVLTGPGGVGKTRLALSAAARAQAMFRDGVAVVGLGTCVPETVDAAAAREQVRQAVRAVLPSVRGAAAAETDLLLVIDNAEHVARCVSRLVLEIQVAHPGIRVLITSRRPLAITSADMWEVAPLEVETWGDADTPPAAVELFLRRVRSAVPTVSLAGRMPLVVELCRRLEGFPRAIETAAQCIRSVSLESLLRSGSTLHMVDQVHLTTVSRHRSLNESVRWSYELLAAPERALLHQLACSFETFTIEDVMRSRLAGRGEAEIVASLAELADASLLRVHRGARYEYRMYRVVRDYVLALERRNRASVPELSRMAFSA